MRRKRKEVFFICLLIIIGFAVGMRIKSLEEDSGLRIVKWSNFYNGKNIHFCYGSSEKSVLDSLKETYQLEIVVGKEKNDFDKSLKLMKWVKDKLNYKDGTKSYNEEVGAIDILEEGQKNKNKKYYSNKECTTVFNECAIALGITSRIGEVIALDNNKEKEGFKVCEIWSDKYNKWIMIDVSNGCYLTYKGVPLSAVEAIEKGIDNFNVEGIENSKKYKKKMGRFFGAYIMSIDNSIYGIKNSNSYIVFLKNDNDMEIPVDIYMNYPIIFTKNRNLFELSPHNKFVDKKEDKIPTLIFSKKNSKENNNEVQFYGGVFQDSIMIKKYYISINDSPFTEVNDYFDFPIKNGINAVKLSIDGKNVVREVDFELKEK